MKDSFETVITDDGSQTLYSAEYGECYHSRGGALTEARDRYVKLCRIEERLDGDLPLSILDVGFGLGYNVAMTLHYWKNHPSPPPLKMTSLEKDRELLDYVAEMEAPEGVESIWPSIQELAREEELIEDDLHLKIELGPAEEKVAQLKDTYDAVYQDPFSPKKNPELWTVDFFRHLYDHFLPQAILSTYSSAIQVKLNLMAAGFRVGPGPKAAAKVSGTLASRQAEIPTFHRREWGRLKRRFQKDFDRPYQWKP